MIVQSGQSWLCKMYLMMTWPDLLQPTLFLFPAVVKWRTRICTWPLLHQFWVPWVSGLYWGTAPPSSLNSPPSVTLVCSWMLTRPPGSGYDIIFERRYLLDDIWCVKCFVFQSIVTLGAAIGGLLGGWMVEKIGRKLSLMFCSLPFVFGFTVIIAAQNVWMLYVGRLLTGLASGVTSLVVPVINRGFIFFNNCNIWDWKRKLLWENNKWNFLEKMISSWLK